MKKEDLKKLVLSGVMMGCLSVTQSGIAEEGEILEEVSQLVTADDQEMEEILAAGCGGKNGCGGQKSKPQNRNINEEDPEYYQGQGQGHGCQGQRPQPYQGRIA